MSTPEEVFAVAVAVRNALEASSVEERPSSWSGFPRGACGDTSLVLGAFLADVGFREFEYVYGVIDREDGSISTHGWLQWKNLIVDITADQFADVNEAVIVEDESAWHRRYRISQRTLGDFRQYPVEQVVELYRLYANLKKRLSA